MGNFALLRASYHTRRPARPCDRAAGLGAGRERDWRGRGCLLDIRAARPDVSGNCVLEAATVCCFRLDRLWIRSPMVDPAIRGVDWNGHNLLSALDAQGRAAKDL